MTEPAQQTIAMLVELAAGLDDDMLERVVSDLQAIQAARRATAQRTVVTHEAGAVA